MKLFILLAQISVIFCGDLYSGYQVIRVTPRNEDDVNILDRIHATKSHQVEFWTGRFRAGKQGLLYVSPSANQHLKDILTKRGIPHIVTIPDVQREVDRQEAQRAALPQKEDPYDIDFEQYHRFDTLMGWLDRVSAACGSRCTTFDIGNSFEGRGMKAIKITGDGSARNSVYVDGGIHAREWIAPATVVWIINEFIKNYDSNPRIKAAVDKYDWYFLPVVNPDGYMYTEIERLWRKTRQPSEFDSCVGADGNRNFDISWDDWIGSSPFPCDDDYAGDSVWSEPEVRYIRDHINYLSNNLTGYVSYHSAGQWWLSPWGYLDVDPPDYDEQMRVSRLICDGIRSVHGEDYEPGPISELLYLASGSSVDWVYQNTDAIYSYTPELRDTGFYGFLLPPEFIRPTGEENLEGILVMAEQMNTNLKKKRKKK